MCGRWQGTPRIDGVQDIQGARHVRDVEMEQRNASSRERRRLTRNGVAPTGIVMGSIVELNHHDRREVWRADNKISDQLADAIEDRALPPPPLHFEELR